MGGHSLCPFPPLVGVSADRHEHKKAWKVEPNQSLILRGLLPKQIQDNSGGDHCPSGGRSDKPPAQTSSLTSVQRSGSGLKRGVLDSRPSFVFPVTPPAPPVSSAFRVHPPSGHFSWSPLASLTWTLEEPLSRFPASTLAPRVFSRGPPVLLGSKPYYTRNKAQLPHKTVDPQAGPASSSGPPPLVLLEHTKLIFPQGACHCCALSIPQRSRRQ